jgi:hypothetical protein
MSSLLVFYRIYRLAIESVMLVFSIQTIEKAHIEFSELGSFDDEKNG